MEGCLKELKALEKPYKYVISCIIMQKNGAGIATAASMTWDLDKDQYCQVA